MYTFSTRLIFSASKYRMLIKIITLMKCVWNTSTMYPEFLKLWCILTCQVLLHLTAIKDKLSINGRSSQEIIQN